MILYILVLIALFAYEIYQVCKFKGYYNLKIGLVNVPRNKTFSFLRILSIVLSMSLLYPKYSVTLILSILIIYLVATVMVANLLYFIRTDEKFAIINAVVISFFTIIVGLVIILLLNMVIQHISIYLNNVND